MKTGVFYATSTGTTREIADRIARALGVADTDVHDVADTAPSVLGDYNTIIIGSPTYGAGELQDDMFDFLDGAEALDLSGKTVAVFGCGDESMSSTFCNAVGIIYNRLKATGATMKGAFNTYPYEFDRSEAVPVQGGEAVGLLIDEVNHPDATEQRVSQWVSRVV